MWEGAGDEVREVGESWKNKSGLEPSHLKVMGDMLAGWDGPCSPSPCSP